MRHFSQMGRRACRPSFVFAHLPVVILAHGWTGEIAAFFVVSVSGCG